MFLDTILIINPNYSEKNFKFVKGLQRGYALTEI